MSTSVLATKLFAPARRRQFVARPRLAEELATTLAAGHRLTLVSAPAGFGKTTVLSDWVAHVVQRHAHAHVGWLSLDDGDNDLTRFLTHLVAALRSVALDQDSSIMESVDTASVPAVLTALINHVSRAGEDAPGQQWVLVIDDYHAIEALDVHEAVTFLLDHLPDHLHLVMATRADPPLPLARLRSRGQLTELRAADLRFTPAEAREFLNQTMGLDLTPAHVEALDERTEGWIAGLQLAALSLSGISDREQVASFIEAFTGSNRFVIDYLADEVLVRQPAEVRDFLLETAVLVRLTGPLCDAVTARTDGATMLEDLERSNLFLVPLDTQRSWYRYHHLFADVLHARLLADRPQRVRVLHERASAWFNSHGLIEDAVRHALAAEDFDRAAYLMEKALPELRRTRQDGLLLVWARSLPESVIRCSPVLSILSASSLLMSGDLDAVDSRLDDADAALASAARDPDLAAAWADTDDLRTAPATISVFRASLAQARGDVAGTVRHARHALDLAEPADRFVRGGAGGFLGLAAWAAGDVQEALSTFSEAIRNLHAAGHLVDEVDGTIVLADLHVASGRPGRARRLYEQALQTATEGGEPYLRATPDLHVGLAELDRELNDLQSAGGHLESSRVLGEQASITENRHRWFVAMAQLRVAGGDYDTATGLLDQAQTLYRHGFYPDVRPIAAMKIRVQIAAGNLDAATGWAHDQGVDVDDAPDYLREYEHLTLVRLLIAQHRVEHRVEPRGSVQFSGRLTSPSPSTAALGLLDRLHAAATNAGRDGSLLEIRVLQALAHHADGDLPQALVALDRALGDGPEPENYVRLYLDEGPPMMALLHHAASATDPAGERAATRALDAHGEQLRDRARRLIGRATTLVGGLENRRSPSEPMSQRELEVLRLLDSELTGPQIARELFVTLNTLRTHTKRIFTKLDANTRAAAVQRARESGLL